MTRATFRPLAGALAAASLLAAGPLAAQANRASPEDMVTVMNPVVENHMVDRLPLSPRLNTLNGKTLYMLDINWGGPDAAYSVFEQVAVWFKQNMPEVKTEIRRKNGSYMNNDPKTWEEIKEKADAVLVGISG
jgi:hypothetical protein